MKAAIGTILFLASSTVFACDVSIDFSQSPYNTLSNSDAGYTSEPSERVAAVYQGVQRYNLTNDDARGKVCTKFKDKSTEEYRVVSSMNPTPVAVEGSLKKGGEGEGSGGGGGYIDPGLGAGSGTDWWSVCQVVLCVDGRNRTGTVTVGEPTAP